MTEDELDLLDQFATHAMAALIIAAKERPKDYQATIARDAYALADAMFAEKRRLKDETPSIHEHD
jgi:hypothetical protein